MQRQWLPNWRGERWSNRRESFWEVENLIRGHRQQESACWSHILANTAQLRNGSRTISFEAVSPKKDRKSGITSCHSLWGAPFDPSRAYCVLVEAWKSVSSSLLGLRHWALNSAFWFFHISNSCISLSIYMIKFSYYFQSQPLSIFCICFLPYCCFSVSTLICQSQNQLWLVQNTRLLKIVCKIP